MRIVLLLTETGLRESDGQTESMHMGPCSWATHETKGEAGCRDLGILGELAHEDARVVSTVRNEFADMNGCKRAIEREYPRAAEGGVARWKDDGPASSRVSRAATRDGARAASAHAVQRLHATIVGELGGGEGAQWVDCY